MRDATNTSFPGVKFPSCVFLSDSFSSYSCTTLSSEIEYFHSIKKLNLLNDEDKFELTEKITS